MVIAFGLEVFDEEELDVVFFLEEVTGLADEEDAFVLECLIEVGGELGVHLPVGDREGVLLSPIDEVGGGDVRGGDSWWLGLGCCLGHGERLKNDEEDGGDEFHGRGFLGWDRMGSGRSDSGGLGLQY